MGATRCKIGIHLNYKLQKAVDDNPEKFYGLEFEILESCKLEELDELELKYINELLPALNIKNFKRKKYETLLEAFDIMNDNLLAERKGCSVNYKELFEAYCDAKERELSESNWIIFSCAIAINFELVKKAYEKLGADKLKELDYNKSKIQKELKLL